MNQLKNIAKRIINILCIILFIILCLVIYAKVKITFTNDKVHANYFGYRVFEIASGSMEPTLSVKDVIIVKVNNKKLNKDDIIAYVGDNDSIITHRIIMIDKDNLIVKGDANNTVDSPINRNQVIGKVVKIYPQLGIWKRILTEPKTLILIFITFLLFDAALSYDGKKQVKKDKDDIKKDKKEEKVEEEKEEYGDKELLEFTRKIDLNEIDSLLKKKKKEKEEEEIELLSDTTEYTIRLDLNEIQKNIKKMDK